MNYIPHTEEDRRAMLARVGAGSIDELFADLPDAVRLRRGLDLPPGRSELEVDRRLRALADGNSAARAVCFVGGGMYDHFIPAAEMALLQRGEFLTSYTPYQPEVSQGTLQAAFEFQTAICELCGMDVANASMYDGSTAFAEAALLAVAATGRRRLVVSRALNPEYRQVLATYARGRSLEVAEAPRRGAATDLDGLEACVDDRAAAVLIQQPSFLGAVEDVAAAAAVAHRRGALLVAVADPAALGVLAAPGAQGADVVAGDGQGLGVPLSYGGPTLGFLAVRGELVRRIPGRLAGLARDAGGRRGFVLALQTREQHIRRGRATSNICTNEALLALAATIYLTLLGPDGLRQAGELCLRGTRYAAARLAALPGVQVLGRGDDAAGTAPRPGSPEPQPLWFKEFPVRLPAGAVQALAEQGFLVGPELGRWYPELEGWCLLAVTERRTRREIDRLVAAVEALLP